MIQKTLTPQQLERISEVDSPILRQRYALYVQLPEDLQETMFAEKTTNTIWVILKDKYNLTKENLNILSKVIGLVMLGEIPIKNFVIELAKELGIDNNQASSLAQDINQQIFQSVRESLMEVHGIREKLGLENKKIISNQATNKPKPISIEELEKINKPRTSSNQHTISSELENETNKRRERLLEKLKQDRKEERVVNLSSKTLPKNKNTKLLNPSAELEASKTQKEQGPEAITTAWNGRTIDLTKIPPRRKSTRKKDIKIKIHEA